MSDISKEEEAVESDSELISEHVPDPVEWLLFAGNRWGVTMSFLVTLFIVL